MNREEIVTVLRELNKITGFRVSLHGDDYAEIAAYPDEPQPFCAFVNRDAEEHKKCVECDTEACVRALEEKDTYIYKCRYGLTESVSPLYNFGTLTGYLMIGQTAECEEDRNNVYQHMLKLSGDETAARSASEKLPVIPADMIQSYAKIMTICAQYLTLSNAMPSAKPTVAELAKKYIHESYTKKIGIGDICNELKCSKSTLLSGFKAKYGVTVNSYINDVRLEAAQGLLERSEKNINEIALACGFSDQSYFSKVFSAKFGIPPSEYRDRAYKEQK